MFRVIHELFQFKGRRQRNSPYIAPTDFSDLTHLLVEPSLAFSALADRYIMATIEQVWLERIGPILSLAGMGSRTHVMGNLRLMKIVGPMQFANYSLLVFVVVVIGMIVAQVLPRL